MPGGGQPPVPDRLPLEPAAGGPGLRQDLQGRAEEGGLHPQVRFPLLKLVFNLNDSVGCRWEVVFKGRVKVRDDLF